MNLTQLGMPNVMHVREPTHAEINRRRVIITKRYNVIGSQKLSHHPRVKKHWELPRDYCLIEIRDCADQISGFPNSHELAVARLDEAALFAPFYHSIKSIAEIMTLHVPFPTVIYHLVTDRKSVLRWPQLSFNNEWETSLVLHAACRVNTRQLEELEIVQASISEWASSMLRTGELRVFGPVASEGRKYAVTCEFSRASGDAAMALFMVVTDAMAAYHLRSVSFHAPKGWASSVKRTLKANGKANGPGEGAAGQDEPMFEDSLICGG